MSVASDDESEQLAGEDRGDRGPGFESTRQLRGRPGLVDVVCSVVDAQPVKKGATLCERVDVTSDVGHLVEVDPRPREEMQPDRQDDLSHDDQIVVEDEAVNGGGHRALDGVLQGHEALVSVDAATTQGRRRWNRRPRLSTPSMVETASCENEPSGPR